MTLSAKTHPLRPVLLPATADSVFGEGSKKSQGGGLISSDRRGLAGRVLEKFSLRARPAVSAVSLSLLVIAIVCRAPTCSAHPPRRKKKNDSPRGWHSSSFWSGALLADLSQLFVAPPPPPPFLFFSPAGKISRAKARPGLAFLGLTLGKPGPPALAYLLFSCSLRQPL